MTNAELVKLLNDCDSHVSWCLHRHDRDDYTTRMLTLDVTRIRAAIKELEQKGDSDRA